jgi:hypothetical protein
MDCENLTVSPGEIPVEKKREVQEPACARKKL